MKRIAIRKPNHGQEDRTADTGEAGGGVDDHVPEEGLRLEQRENKRLDMTGKDQTEKVDGELNWQDLPWDERLRITSEPSSIFSESFRQLRTRILHAYNGGAPRSILVTSFTEGEGKGFVCSNLGVALAKGISQHALLVDCDLRRPTLSGLFGLKNEMGLADYLQGKADLSSLIKKTGLPKLSILSSGISPPNPSELLVSEHMASLMQELSGRYNDRFILLDSPPMHVASETAVLARYVDGIVLVIRWGAAGKEQIKRLLDEVGKDKILGVVFNGDKINKLEAILYKSRYYGYYQKKY